jgi:DNA-binding NarL/FixJ family response regulator
MTPIRVLIADEHYLLRDGIPARQENGLEVTVVLQAGARGCFLTDSVTDELQLEEIQPVRRRDSCFGPAVSMHVIAADLDCHGAGARSSELLTPRQREILRMIALGRTTKSIARTLGISVKTVEAHRAQLMGRLDIHDVASLVRYAIRIGLTHLDE